MQGRLQQLVDRVRGNTRVVFSERGNHYYVPFYAKPFDMWLSVKAALDPGAFGAEPAEQLPDGWRAWLPFVFWSLRSGNVERRKFSDPLVVAYAVAIARKRKREAEDRRFTE